MPELAVHFLNGCPVQFMNTTVRRTGCATIPRLAIHFPNGAARAAQRSAGAAAKRFNQDRQRAADVPNVESLRLRNLPVQLPKHVQVRTLAQDAALFAVHLFCQ